MATRVETNEPQQSISRLVEKESLYVASPQARSRHSKPQLNLRSESKLFATLFGITSIGLLLRQLATTIAVEAESSSNLNTAPSTCSFKGEAESTPADGMQPGERVQLESETPEPSSPIVVAGTPADDKECHRNQSVWIRYEPRVGPWVNIEFGDQLIATHDFARFGIRQWEIGSLVRIEIEKEDGLVVGLTLGFRINPECFYTDPVEPFVDIEDKNPEPSWSTPFVLLDRSSKRPLPILRLESNAQVHDLIREGTHPFRVRNTSSTFDWVTEGIVGREQREQIDE